MKYYEDTSAPLTEEGIKSVEKVKKIVEDYFHTFKGNEPLSLQYSRNYDDDDWVPSEWANQDGFSGKIFNIDNVEWIEYFFGAYLTDKMTHDDDYHNGEDDQYLDITFYKNVANDYQAYNEFERSRETELRSLANQVKADLSYCVEEIESQSTSADWKWLPTGLPKSWIDKFKKFNGKEIDNGQITYSGSGDDGSVEFFDGSLWGDNTPTPMDAMGFTQTQIGKMYDMYEKFGKPHDGVICGYEENWTYLIEEFTNSFANFNNEGCHGEITSTFFYDEKKHRYGIEHFTDCSFGGQSTVRKIMLIEDFLKTKPRMN